MSGKFSKNKFFNKLIQAYFKGTESIQPEDIEQLLKKAEMKLYILNAKKKKKRFVNNYDLILS